MSVVTAHMVYFCDFARSEIFQKNARELGVGRGQFHSGVNGLKNKVFSFYTLSEKCAAVINIVMDVRLRNVHEN